ncbi:MAG: hypothetical protein JXL97_02440 [Bacteroidales bacterium]|nr:hypothetical protein [Bacteroidales bacterium]
MIKKLLNMWKVDGMDYLDNSSRDKTMFEITFKDKLIGILEYDKKWIFFYSDEFKNNPFITPITDFPDINKKYESNSLWPFFATRIPTLNQPFHFKKIEKAKIDKNDPVALLKLFGSKSISNPFHLNPL